MSFGRDRKERCSESGNHVNFKYRHDIDGLRAIAVMLVVLYHFDVEVLAGGFIGVDVFFVISGFLITRIIADDMRNNSFQFRSFWSRRIRRLLPASLTMVLVVLLVFWFIYPHSLYQDVGRSSLAQLFFSSNMYFWSGSSYFAVDSELKPLLHTWSLSVEEQFYFLFPFLLYAAFKINKSWLPGIAAALSLASYIFSITIYDNEASGAFFWLPSRAWELGVGACLALSYRRLLTEIRWLSISASTIGAIIILYSALAFDEFTPFPHTNALFPVIGTALIIWGNEETNNPLRLFLQLRPVVFIGLISYSLYLWHWPIKVIAAWYSLPLTNLNNFTLAITLTFSISWASYQFIEKPFRTSRKV